MAEKIEIINLNINQDELIKNMEGLSRRLKEQKEEIQDLTKANEELLKAGKTNTQQYKDNKAQIEITKANVKGLSKEYRTNQNVLVDIVSSEKAQLGTLQQLALENKKLRSEQRSLNLTTKEGVARNKEINAQINKNTKFTKEHSDALVQDKMNIGNYQSALDGLPGPMGMFVSRMKSMTTAALKFIATPIGAVIALIAGAIGLLTKGFKNSQGLMDLWSKTMDGIGAAIAVVADRISDFTEFIVSIFNKEMRESRKETQALNDELLGLDDSMSKREKRRARRQAKKSLADEIKEEYQAARTLKEDLIALEDAEIAYTKTKAELKKSVEEYRLIAKDANITEGERLVALDKAIELEKQMITQEVEFAKERARISQAQVDLGRGTREEMKENAELQARAIEVEAKGIKRIRTIASERLSTVRRINAAEAKAIEDKRKAYEAELKLWRDFDEQVNKQHQEALDERYELDMAALDKEIELQIAAEERADEYKKSKLIFNLQSEQLLKEQAAQNEYDRKQLQLDAQYQAEVEAAEKVGGDVALINQRFALVQVAQNA